MQLGAALIHGAPTDITPVRANGPHDVFELATTEPLIFVQLIGGAETVSLGVLSHIDDLGSVYQLKGAPLTMHKVSGRGDDTEHG